MPKFDPIFNNFTSGELSPLFSAHIDQKKYLTGAALITNFLSRTQGPLTRRPGTQFIAATKNSAKTSRLVPFIFSTIQAYILEFGDGYIRFYKDKGQIVNPDTTPYELVSPYAESELSDIKFVQSADVLYITHSAHPPRTLSRRGHTSWFLEEIDFADGPYFDENITDTTLQPSGTSGTITITASPAQGPEKIVNGAFDVILGSELVQDPNFDTGTGWTLGGTWAYDAIGKEADHAAGDATAMSNAIAAEIGSIYKVVFEIKNYVAGNVTAGFGGASGAARSADGVYTEYLIATTTGALLFTPIAAFDGSIDNVSVKKVGLDSYWVWGTGWTHDYVNAQADHTPGSTAALEQDIQAVINEIYDVVFTVSNRTAGSVTAYIGNANGAAVSANGTASQTITPTAAGNLRFVPTTDFDGSIDTVSVKVSASGVAVFNQGHVGSFWRIKEADTWGWFRITSYIDKNTVQAQVMKTLDTTASGSPNGSADTPLGVLGSKTDITGTLAGTAATKSWREGAWSDYRGYPACLSFFEERLFFAGTPTKPQTIWGSKSGDFTNFAPEDVITDEGPVTYTLASNQVDAIFWLSPGRVLIVGTSESEAKISGSTNDTALSPTNVSVRRDTSYGSANLQPVPMGMVTLFLQRYGRKIRELTYDFASDSYVAPDMTLLCEHITAGGIVAMDYQSDPDHMLWAVRADGVLLSMIYERSQEVVGWTKHITDGAFESVATIPGTNQTEIWVIVKRVIDGATVRYVECFKNVEWGARPVSDTFLTAEAREYANAFFVDCGLTYDPTPAKQVSVISGLDHLEGETVHVLSDGVVQAPKVVSSGQITLDFPAYVVHVGLPFVSPMATVRPEGGWPGGTSQGKQKRIVKVTLRLDKSLNCQVGPDAANLERLTFRNIGDNMDTALPLFTGDITTEFRGDFDTLAQVMIVQDQPLPLTILAIMPEINVENSTGGMIKDFIMKFVKSVLGSWR